MAGLERGEVLKVLEERPWICGSDGVERVDHGGGDDVPGAPGRVEDFCDWGDWGGALRSGEDL